MVIGFSLIELLIVSFVRTEIAFSPRLDAFLSYRTAVFESVRLIASFDDVAVM
jgi:hypothetical protein